MTNRAKILSLGISLPGESVPLREPAIDSALVEQLKASGQEFTFVSEGNSTELALQAARDGIQKSGLEPDKIHTIISAPTLLTSYGFEIPAIALAAQLGLNRAQCVNISQGCTGFLVALKMAEMILRTEGGQNNILIVSACKASTLMDQFTHGSFFWGDGAVAAVITAPGDRGLHYCAYAEANAGADWGAMRLDHGDGVPFAECAPARDLKIIVDFPDIRAQADYISGEKDRCGSVIRALLEANELGEEDIAALFLPSIGKNRVPILLEDFPGLREKLGTDFRYAHMGGVDVMYFVHKHLAAGPPAQDEYYIALTPAFTAQWGGVLLNYQA